MTIVRQLPSYLIWLLRATTRLLHVDRRSTTILIIAIIGSQFATMLALLLPLKVILLVGSDGIPSYFQFLVTEQTKTLWVAILTIGTFVLLLSSKYLDTLTNRHSLRGARQLLAEADQAPISNNETEITESTYHRLTSTVAMLLFTVLTIAVGLFLFPPLFVAIVVLLVAEFAVASIMAGELNGAPSGRIARHIRQKSSETLKFVRNMNFLLVFVFILASLLLSDSMNRLIAIASIILSRQAFGSLGDAIKNSIKLVANQQRANALLFPDSRLNKSIASPASKAFEELFRRDARLGRIRSLDIPAQVRGDLMADEIEYYREQLRSVSASIWVDSATSRFSIFDLYGTGRQDGGSRILREYVYTFQGAKRLTSHDYLTRHLTSEDLRALQLITKYQEGTFTGRIFQYTDFMPLERRSWRRARADLLNHFASLSLPEDLIASYRSACLQLHERIGDPVMGRLRVAADEPWADESYQQLDAQLPELCARVANLPVALQNNRLVLSNIVNSVTYGARVLDWSSWAIEPLGAGFNLESDQECLMATVDYLNQSRDCHSYGALGMSDVVSAALLSYVEHQSLQGRPKRALWMAHQTLPLLGLSDRDVGAALAENNLGATEEYPQDRYSEGELDVEQGAWSESG